MASKNELAEGPPLWARLLVGRRPRRTLLRALVLAVCCAVFFGLVVRPARIAGSSMEPTVSERSFRLIYLLAYRTAPPQRGEIVAINGIGSSLMYLKRVVGLPGETVAFREGTLLINGKPQAEPYLVFRGQWDMDPETLGRNEYFVTGDNRDMPRRDHTHGVVRRGQIAGRLLW
jgi:signal peptidase I